MTITSKQRANLRGQAQSIEPVAQFGKGDLTAEQITMIGQVLLKRELIKCSVLESSNFTPAELANMLAEETNSIVVQTIGRRFVLYRRNDKDPKISLN